MTYAVPARPVSLASQEGRAAARRRLPRWLVLACAFALCWAAAPAHAARPPWHIALILDRSGSMQGHDPAMNALAAPAILADLAVAGDTVEVFPQGGAHVPPIQVDPRDRASFKKALLALPNGSQVGAATSAAFAAAALGTAAGRRTALVMVYDGDDAKDPSPGFGTQIASLRAAGGQGYVLGMGPATAGKPPMVAFGETARVVNSGRELLDAYAATFRTLLGTRRAPPTGTAAPGAVRVVIPPGATEAWFVALADGEVRGVRPVAGPPGADLAAATEPPGSGWTWATYAGRPRGYRVVRVVAPAPGVWEFAVDTDATQVDWLLLPMFELRLRPSLDIRGTPRQGQTVPLVVELEGRPPAGTKVTATLDGKTFPLDCEGGRCRTLIQLERAGPQQIALRADNEDLEVTSQLDVDAAARIAGLLCDDFRGGDLQQGGTLVVGLRASAGGLAPRQARLEASDGTVVDLRNDGQGGDAVAGDDLWSAQIEAKTAGPLRIAGVMRTDEGETRCEASFTVLPCVDPVITAPPGPIAVGPCRDGADDASCSACGGGCAGVDVPLGVGQSLTAGGTVQGSLRLGGPLPEGVTAWLGHSEVRVDGGPAVALGPGAPPLTLRLCTTSCPAAWEPPPLVVRVAVERAFGCQAPGAAGRRTGSATVPVAPERIGWLWCLRWHLAAAAAAIALALLVWGLARSLRFPKPGQRRRRFPALWCNADAKDAPQVLDSGRARRTRADALGGGWNSDQRLLFDGARAAMRGPGLSALAVELRRVRPPRATGGKPELGPVAWISAPTGLMRTRQPYSGKPWGQFQRQDFEAVPAGGEELQLDHLYVLDGNPRAVYVFRA